MILRCGWCGNDPDYIAYHDLEWGVPEHRDERLFELLILEGAQAGLSWLTILRKRKHYRTAYANFDPYRVARFTARDKQRLLADPGLVRNRLKIDASIANARGVVAIAEEFGSLDAFLWRYTEGRTLHNTFKSLKELPSSTPLSDAMSKDLKRRGFNFVGSTICYAFMQATGMVNDHLIDCFRYRDILTASPR